MKFYITHIITDKLPSLGFKQISFLTSNASDYLKKIFYLGYDGAVKLNEEQLSLEISEGKIIRLAKPIITTSKPFLWLDPNGGIFKSEEHNSSKEFVENSGIKPYSESRAIFEKTFERRLDIMDIQTRIKIS
jgi:hypothetical protein